MTADAPVTLNHSMNTPITQRICCGLLHRQVRLPVDVGEHDTALELRKKIYNANKGLAYWGTPVEKLHLWRLSPPVDTEDERPGCSNELGNFPPQQEHQAVGRRKLSDKIVDVFETSERQGTAVQVLLKLTWITHLVFSQSLQGLNLTFIYCLLQ